MDIQNIKGVATPKIISHCTEVGKVSQKINQFNPFKTFQRDGGNNFGGPWHWTKREKKNANRGTTLGDYWSQGCQVQKHLIVKIT